MSPPVIAIVGDSDSGKTTVAVSLVETLTREGYRVAAIKHTPHGHHLGRAEADSERLYRAGAWTVVAASTDRTTRTDRTDRVRREPTLESLVASVGGVDLVVAEGFKGSSAPKVLVTRGESPPPQVSNVVAVVSDLPGPAGLPTYSFEDVDALARQVKTQYLERSGTA